MTQVEEIRSALDAHSIIYEYAEHQPVMTIDEFKEHEVYSKGLILKNLFLRDDKGKNMFVLTCLPDARIDMPQLAQSLGVKKLSFGSSERLMKHLQLLPGAVSPLGMVFDKQNSVTLVFDKALQSHKGPVGIHPGSNAATVLLKFSELLRLLEAIGVEPIFIAV